MVLTRICATIEGYNDFVFFKAYPDSIPNIRAAVRRVRNDNEFIEPA